jgi:hypothetical protein
MALAMASRKQQQLWLSSGNNKQKQQRIGLSSSS